MAYATGTAQNERDLLDKINKFLTEDETLKRDGQAWTVLLDRKLNETATKKKSVKSHGNQLVPALSKIFILSLQPIT